MLKTSLKMINKNSAVYIAIVLLLIVIMVWIGTSVFVRVLYIDIRGAYVYSEEEILEVSDISRGDNLVHMNLNAVAQNIRTSLPFVREVNILRRLPDTLVIEIVESDPIAYMMHENNILVIDTDGRVLQSGLYSSIGLIEIRGLPVSEAELGTQLRAETGSEARFQDMVDVLSALHREELAEHVTLLDVSNVQGITFTFMNLYRVLIGSAGELRVKLFNLTSAVETLAIERPGVRGDIDVSNPSAAPRFIETHDGTYQPPEDNGVSTGSEGNENESENNNEGANNNDDLDNSDDNESELETDEN